MIDAITAALLLVGALFTLLGALGLLRMPDAFTRMQASTKASTLGVGCLLVATALQLGDVASIARAGAIGAFLMLTLPVASHVIARAAYLSDSPLWEGTVLDQWREDRGPDLESPRSSQPGPEAGADLAPPDRARPEPAGPGTRDGG